MRRLSENDWFQVRVAYRVALIGVFALVAFQIGPAVWIYGRLTSPAPSDFVDLVNEQCVPVLKAMVAYHRDTREWPYQSDVMVPKYLPKALAELPVWTQPDGHVTFPMFRKLLRVHYAPRPGGGDWTIEGPSLNGPVPAAPVPDYQPLSDDGTNR